VSIKNNHMRIAVCDDRAEERELIVSFLQEYSLANGRPFLYRVAENGFALMDFIEKGEVFDLIILDIIMPGMTGIETARAIRKYDAGVKILFLTSSAEFAVESYSVGAYHYLLKPINREVFFDIFEKAVRQSGRQNEECIIVSDGKAIRRLLLADIVYIEIMKRTVSFHLHNGSVVESQGTLSGLEQDVLRHSFFAKPHRSYLVNLRHVTGITGKEIKTDIDSDIPMARGRYQAMRDAFLAETFPD